jgi:hypothetical protein
MKLFGAALVAAGLALGSYSLAQVPGTSLPPGIRSTGAPACTPNTGGGGTFANVVGLWHFDNNGADNGSSGAKTLTLNGGAVYSTTQAKFGTHSLSIVTGGTSYAQLPAAAGVLVAASTDFTVEAWLYFPTTAPTYMGWIGDDQTTWLGPYAQPNLTIQIAGASVSATPTAATSFPPNVWHHYAVVRQSNAIQFYTDGAQASGGGGTNSNVVGSASVGSKIGRSYSATYVQPSGSFIDEARISNVARYTANFTPPVLAFCNN